MYHVQYPGYPGYLKKKIIHFYFILIFFFNNFEKKKITWIPWISVKGREKVAAKNC